MASTKAQGKSRAKEQKSRKFQGPEQDPTDYATLYKAEFHIFWSSLHFDEQTLYIKRKQREASTSNISQCLVMAYVTDTPSRWLESYIILTPADIGQHL